MALAIRAAPIDIYSRCALPHPQLPGAAGVHETVVTYPKRPIATDFRIGPITEDLLRAAGTAPDTVIAEKFGILAKDVAIIRNRHGVAPFGGSVWDGVDDLLGLWPDRDIAQRLGVDPASVRRRRVKLGIEPYSAHQPVLTGKHDDVLQGALRSEELAAQLGVPLRAIVVRRTWLRETYGTE